MPRKSVSPRPNEREWLQSLYEKRRSRSLEIGVKAIDMLLKEGNRISYKSVSEKSKEVDPKGIGIHPNTIHTNPELHDYYVKYKKNVTRSSKKAPMVVDADLVGFMRIKPDRDLERVRQRYMKATKAELVDILIRMEHYIAQQNQHWLKDQFEQFEND